MQDFINVSKPMDKYDLMRELNEWCDDRYSIEALERITEQWSEYSEACNEDAPISFIGLKDYARYDCYEYSDLADVLDEIDEDKRAEFLEELEEYGYGEHPNYGSITQLNNGNYLKY